MEFLLVILVLVVIGYAATKTEDARIVARGEELAAPEWARWLLILAFAVGAPVIIGAILLTVAAVAP